jgi:hypothetical protein
MNSDGFSDVIVGINHAPNQPSLKHPALARR